MDIINKIINNDDAAYSSGHYNSDMASLDAQWSSRSSKKKKDKKSSKDSERESERGGDRDGNRDGDTEDSVDNRDMNDIKYGGNNSASTPVVSAEYSLNNEDLSLLDDLLDQKSKKSKSKKDKKSKLALLEGAEGLDSADIDMMNELIIVGKESRSKSKKSKDDADSDVLPERMERPLEDPCDYPYEFLLDRLFSQLGHQEKKTFLLKSVQVERGYGKLYIYRCIYMQALLSIL